MSIESQLTRAWNEKLESISRENDRDELEGPEELSYDYRRDE